MLYRVTIVYERTKDGFGSRKAIYESFAVVAPNEAQAKVRATRASNWPDLTIATVAVDPCDSNVLYLRDGQVTP